MNHPTGLKQRFPVALCVCASILLASVAASPSADPRHYLRPGQPDFVALLAPPPLRASAEQAADLAAVVAVHQGCTTNETALAFSEKKFSIFTFTPAIGAFFQPARYPKTEAFFGRVQTEAETVTTRAKDYWKRPRPFVVDPSLASGKLEKGFSYPCGHSAEGTVLALVLADVFPDKRDALLAVSRDLGWHRVWIARHYPTDVHAGRVFAQAIVREMEANPDFQRDLAEARQEIEAAQYASKAIPLTASPVASQH
jgi:acid phosphatase (class A)